MNIKYLSNAELETSFMNLVKSERKITYLVLLHIKEIESRRFYLDGGYKSLFDYLTKNSGYSSSSAQRRIEGARLLRELPELSTSIEEGKINLSQMSEVVRSVNLSPQIVSSEKKMHLLKSIESRSTLETQKILAIELNLEIKDLEIKRVQKNESVRLEITLSKVQNENLLKCRDLSSHFLLNTKSLSLADVIEYLCDKHLKSTAASVARCSKERKDADNARKVQLVKKLRKCVTPKIRKNILNKFKVCQHKDSIAHKICESSFLLQVDHIRPQWAGGNHEDENLTVLCARHNQAKYRKESNLNLR